jgi:hypothetical protein
VRRVLVGGLVLVLAVVLVGAGLLALQSRDHAGVNDAPTGPGERVADRCPAHPSPVTRDRRRLSRAQLETALAQGNVVITYRGGQPDAALRAIQRDLSGSFDTGIAAAGQAVILAPGAVGEARAWGRRLVAGASQGEALRAFADAWLGRGAPKPCR